MDRKNILLLVVICGGIFFLIYTLDIFKLAYRMTDWEKFEDTPFSISHIQYFVANTPDILGYTDHTLGEDITCFESVAYVETDSQEEYRCCDAGEKASCLKGDFSSDIPPADEECIAELREIFGVPDSDTASKEYQYYGRCSGGRFAELTVVQLDNDGDILWKFVEVGSLQTINSVMRCVVGPVMLLIVLWLLYGTFREKPNERVRKF